MSSMIHEEPTFVLSGIRNLIVPVESQAEKAAWLKTNKQKLIKAVKRL